MKKDLTTRAARATLTNMENKYVLIEHGHGPEDPARLTICANLLQLETATANAIYGDPAAFCPELVILRAEGIIHFEGDPPIEWLIVSKISDVTNGKA